MNVWVVTFQWDLRLMLSDDEHTNTSSHFQLERFLPFPGGVRHECLGVISAGTL